MALAASTLTMSAGDGWPVNYGGVMLQGFWWDSYTESQWTALTQRADELSQYFDLIWIPNAGTTSGDYYAMNNNQAFPTQMGYMPCFWLDYNTIFGNEAELRAMIETYREKGVGIIEDVVINHKNGVSSWCDFPNETKTVNGKTYSITWPTDLSSICSNDEAATSSGYTGPKPTGADDTGDNFDGCRDLDHTNAQVQQNIKVYLDYLLNEMGFAGFRYDMVKGFGAQYVGEYNVSANPTFSVGEFWDNQDNTKNWINGTKVNSTIQSAAFDFDLKNKINAAFNNGQYSNLEWKSFTADPSYSRYAVTFAENHDTKRKDDHSKELLNNWSAANAFILTMPGTPCIFLGHYNADPTNIGAMIAARKKAGITNQSQPTRQHDWDNWTGYVLENEGDNGSIYCEFGSAVGNTNPGNGYFVVADGDAYRFYAAEKKTDSKRTVYFDNSANWDNVYCYVWNDNGDQLLGSWPGTKLIETTREGYYKLTIDAEGYDNLIFNNGSGTQTADLKIADAALYNNNGQIVGSVYTPTGNSLLLSTRTDNIHGDNVVNMSASPYHCNNLVITDGYEFNSAVNFTATNASYSRQTSYEWGTLCLPFAALSNNDVQFYQLKAATSETLSFTPIAETAAGMPVAYKVLNGKNAANKYELNITSSNVNVVTRPAASHPIDGWTMEGTFTPTSRVSDSEHNIYYIAENKFWNANQSAPAAPFRAWFETSTELPSRASFRIEEETEAINTITIDEEPKMECYDVFGHRQNTMKQGLNIVNGKKIIIF